MTNVLVAPRLLARAVVAALGASAWEALPDYAEATTGSGPFPSCNRSRRTAAHDKRRSARRKATQRAKRLGHYRS